MRAVLQTLLVASLMGTLRGADDNPARSQVAPNPREIVAAFLDVVAIGDTDGPPNRSPPEIRKLFVRPR